MTLNNNIKSTIYKFLPLILITIYFFIRLPFFMSDAFVPDEIWHTGYMQKWHFTNYQGFGTLYWVFGYVITAIFGKINALFVLRLLALLSICFSAFFLNELYRKRKVSQSISTLLIGIFLTLPMMFYGGKLITPEFYSMFLISLSAYLILKPQSNYNIIPWVILGFTIGLKLSAIVSVGAISLLKISEESNYKIFSKKFITTCFKYSCFILLGFIICSPNLLWDFGGFMKNIQPFDRSSFYAMLFVQNTAWDLVRISSLNTNVISLIVVFILSIVIFFTISIKNFAIYSISFLILLIMIKTNVYYIWHTFQSIFIFFIPFIFTKSKFSKNIFYVITVLLFSALIINIFYSFNLYKIEVQSRNMMVKTMSSTKLYSECLNFALTDIIINKKIQINQIINRIEFGSNAKRDGFSIINAKNLTHPNYKDILILETKRHNFYENSITQNPHYPDYYFNNQKYQVEKISECGDINIMLLKFAL